MYKMPSDVSALDATLWNPLGGGYEWGVIQGGIKPGDKVLIMGPGQRGLAAIFSARHAGADFVALTGLTKDQFKLDLALEFGADAVVDVAKQDVLEWGREVTGGTGFDVILDTTPHAVQPLVDAVSLAKKKGTIAVIGIKGRTLDNFPVDQFLFKKIKMQGMAGQSDAAQRLAADLVASKRYPLHKMRTHVFGFDQLDTAISVLSGDAPDEKAINVVVTPTMSS
jgi:threonine dehydrogenase-like Zn-dependent dehydrogenase